MNKVIDILKIKDVQKIGSSNDVKIKYVSDIDLQEIMGVRQSRKNINLFINWKIIYSSSDEDEESLSPELPSTTFSSSFSSFSCFPSLPFLCLVL